jgi:hypothetical protein
MVVAAASYQQQQRNLGKIGRTPGELVFQVSVSAATAAAAATDWKRTTRIGGGGNSVGFVLGLGV